MDSEIFYVSLLARTGEGFFKVPNYVPDLGARLDVAG
jgi:hypothetical protein